MDTYPLLVNPAILYRSVAELTALVDQLGKIRDAAPAGIIREKCNPLISMLRDSSATFARDEDVGAY